MFTKIRKAVHEQRNATKAENIYRKMRIPSVIKNRVYLASRFCEKACVFRVQCYKKKLKCYNKF